MNKRNSTIMLLVGLFAVLGVAFLTTQNLPPTEDENIPEGLDGKNENIDLSNSTVSGLNGTIPDGGNSNFTIRDDEFHD